VAQSLEELQQVLRDDPAARSLDAIAHAMQALFRSCETLMEERRRSGAVRECHGDLHLGNLVRLDGRIVPFDALEFDPALRWIDVLNEIAFLVMDLDTRGKRSLAYHFLNRYLDETGEHEGLPVLPFYLAYRALVRAKVLALSPARRDPATRQRLLKLLEYAACPQAGNPPLLILMCGISGSGKSWIASRMAYALPAIHVRSDIERKRLFGVPALGRTDAAVGGGIYAPDASARTYRRLEAIAAAALRAGLPVIVDATHLRREHRAPFIDLARRAGRQAAIVCCRASEATLASRLRQRATAGADPSEATLEVAVAQRSVFESPEAGEADLLAISGEEEGESWEHALAAVRELASTGKAPAVQPADS
jgi:hypothetical protein